MLLLVERKEFALRQLRMLDEAAERQAVQRQSLYAQMASCSAEMMELSLLLHSSSW
jgi:hypothetical protein